VASRYLGSSREIAGALLTSTAAIAVSVLVWFTFVAVFELQAAANKLSATNANAREQILIK
jgi:hypothetical protein